MKILLVSQYFYPENFKGNDIAFELQKKGHQVTVLTGIPNYPEGKFYDGYGFFSKKKEIVNNVTIYRTFLLPRGNSKGIALMLNYASWMLSASIFSIYLAFFKKFDRIFVQQLSPVTMGFPGVILKKLTKTPLYFWVLDLWPESIQAAGGTKNKIVLSAFTKLVRFLYRNSNKILISSKPFKDSILQKGNFGNKIVFFPNWAEDIISHGISDYRIPSLPEGFKVMFAGNVGEAQDMETIMSAFLLLKEKKHIKLILVGEGRRLEYVKEFVQKNNLSDNIITLGRYPQEAMRTFFENSDLLLVSLKDDPIFNMTVPAKIQAYMSSGKPILASLNGEGAQCIIEAGCGFTVKAGDAQALSEKILEISKIDPELLFEKGKKGIKYYRDNYQKEKCINHLEEIMDIKT